MRGNGQGSGGAGTGPGGGAGTGPGGGAGTGPRKRPRQPLTGSEIAFLAAAVLVVLVGVAIGLAHVVHFAGPALPIVLLVALVPLYLGVGELLRQLRT